MVNPITTAKGPAHLSCAAEGTPPEQPGATRGAEVAADTFGIGSSDNQNFWVKDANGGFNYVNCMDAVSARVGRAVCIRIVGALIDAERAAVIDEAEAAVRAYADELSAEKYRAPVYGAIDAVARLRETPCPTT